MDRWWDRVMGQTPSILPPPVLGITSHMLRPEDRSHLRALRIRHVRVPGILQKWEKDSHYRLVLKDMDRAAQQDDLRLLWVLHNVVDGTPARLDDLWTGAQWVERMSQFAEWVARLPATEAVQLWNEPNGYPQMPFGMHEGVSPELTGAHYAQALRLHVERIRAARPGCKVVAAGLTLLPGWQACLREMVAQQPGADAFAIHPYGPWPQARERLVEARSIAQWPVWATEFGNDQLNGEPFDAARHFQCWRTVVEGNTQEVLAPRAYGYCLQTDPRFPQHGLLRTEGGAREAYTWMQRRNL